MSLRSKTIEELLDLEEEIRVSIRSGKMSTSIGCSVDKGYNDMKSYSKINVNS